MIIMAKNYTNMVKYFRDVIKKKILPPVLL